jgi:anti-sigma B factor antagonist
MENPMFAVLKHVLPSSQADMFELSGRLDGDTSASIEEDVLMAIKGGTREILLECSKLDSVTGVGMQSLLRLAREMRSARGKIAVCSLKPRVKEMFDVCGVENMIAIYEDCDSAQAALASL